MPPTDNELLSDLRNRWIHEDYLISQRVSWLLLSQSILFAAFSVVLTAPDNTRHIKLIDILVVGLPILGFSTVICLLIGIRAAMKAQDEIRLMYNKLKDQTLAQPQSTQAQNFFLKRPQQGQLRPNIFELTPSTRVLRDGKMPAYALPVIFAFAWSVLLFSLL